jgi:hypothetical protein
MRDVVVSVQAAWLTDPSAYRRDEFCVAAPSVALTLIGFDAPVRAHPSGAGQRDEPKRHKDRAPAEPRTAIACAMRILIDSGGREAVRASRLSRRSLARSSVSFARLLEASASPTARRANKTRKIPVPMERFAEVSIKPGAVRVPRTWVRSIHCKVRGSWTRL